MCAADPNDQIAAFERMLLDTMSSDYLRLVDPVSRVWEIQDAGLLRQLYWLIRRRRLPADGYDMRRTRLFEHLIRSHERCYLTYEEDPTCVAPQLIRVGEKTWSVPGDVPIKPLYDFLYLGNWSLYGCDARVSPEALPPLDLVKNLEYSLTAMEAQRIALAVDSFYDNDPWHIALAPVDAG